MSTTSLKMMARITFLLVVSVWLAQSVAAQTTCPCSLWNPTTIPAMAADPDSNAVEVGLKFQASVNGFITGIRFYKGAGNTGTHVGHLWSNTGTLLASVTFTNETATGWQQAALTPPVAITANTTYVVSYYAPAGHYAVNEPYFTTAVANGPLQALASGATGGNGVYKYGTSGFPTQTYNTSNYWVDVVFSTSSGTGPDTIPPAVPANLQASAVATTQINLTWSAATDNVAVTGYQLERCQGASCTTFAPIATPTATSFNDTGRTANTTYRYRVRATDAAGNLSNYSSIASATTPALSDTTAPSAPAGLTATAVSATQINLTWSAATDNVAVTGYRLERCQSASCTTFTQIATPTATSFNDTGLIANTTYRYRVRATDAAGNLSNYSAIASATTPALSDTTAPSAPAGLTATAVSATQINLTWSAATDNVAVTGYRLERCQSASCTTFTQIATPTATSFNDTGLIANTTYRYRVRATDAAGNLSNYSAIASATTPALSDTTAPSAPAGLTATAVSATQINLTWSAATDNVAVTGYRLERCQSASCTTFTQIATPTATSFNDTGLIANTTYRYRVRATDAAGNLSNYSAIATATTPNAASQTSGSACNAPPLPLAGTRIINVSAASTLQSAVTNAQAGDTIVIAKGTYNLTNTLYVNGKNDVTIRGNSGCDDVVLVGKGMDNASFGSVQFGIWTNSLHTTIAHLTIRDTYDNALVFNTGAQAPYVYSVKLLNAGAQFIKANPTDGPNGIGVNNGIIEYSWIEYTNGTPANPAHAGGTGYTQALSAHATDNWIVRNNVIKNLHTPDGSDNLWNPAVLFWNHSTNPLVENNVFVNVDRAIGMGLIEQATGSDSAGGTVKNNFIYYAPGLYSASRKAGTDGAIVVYDSPTTQVYHNTILTNGNYNFAIEYRFTGSSAGDVRNNLTDAPLNLARDGASATQAGNYLSATPSMFLNPTAADLHLLDTTATRANVIDHGVGLPAVTDDIDEDHRPLGAGPDVGADELR